MDNIDIIVIGAGSAGCILVNKLINYTNYNILLIEAGPKDISPIVHVPLGYGMTFYNKKINWNFYSARQQNLHNREIYYPRGKVLGGSSSINGMVYTRGLKSDYDNWHLSSELSLENIINSFNEIEQPIDSNDLFISPDKVPVNNVSELHHPILKYFFKGCNEMGINFNKNLNSEMDNQVGHYNITTFKGMRYSSSKVFLKSILKSKRLRIMTKTHVNKLIIKDNKIEAVEILSNNKKIKIKSNLGTVLSSGTIMTPYILMHSGIGNANDLKMMNKDIIINNSNVGKNFQDHLGLDYLFKTYHPTLNSSLGSWSGRVKEILKYFVYRKGSFGLSLNQAGGYVNWNSKNNYPNLQIYFNPITYSITHKNKRPLLKTDKFDGFIIGYNSCRPKSLGEVKLSNPNVNSQPLINPNFLSNEEDIHDVKCAINFTKTLAQTNSIKEIKVSSINNNLISGNEQEMLDHFKENATSVYHPCGTCRMDKEKTKGVVSERFRVHGLDNLWILDASVFPNITSGNINATVMMLANIGSKIIIEDLKKS